jgi:hypothetical protein
VSGDMGRSQTVGQMVDGVTAVSFLESLSQSAFPEYHVMVPP